MNTLTDFRLHDSQRLNSRVKRGAALSRCALMAAALASSGIAAAQQALPPVVGSELEGTSKSKADISIDGTRIDVTGFNKGGFIPDVDGDGIVEAYLKASEPGQPCETLVYLPSRQARTASISSANLGVYIRIRNFGAVPDASGSVRCPDNSQRLRVFGDLNGDGVDEISTQYAYNGELIINGAVPYGTLIEAANSVPGQVAVVADDLEVNPVGDVNGDGRVDWSIYSYSDEPDRRNDCLLIASQAGGLRTEFNFSSVAGEPLLASLSRTEQERCPRMTSVGDVNGDGFGDIVIFDDEHWLVHGSAQRTLDDSYRQYGYRIFNTCSDPECQQSMDFDADGFDDVLVRVSDNLVAGLLAGTGSVVLYGSAEGVIGADAINPLPANRATQIVQKYYNPRVEFGLVASPLLPGDINGDGADEILFRNTALNRELAGSILYGTPGRRPAVLIEASIDGGNGVFWSEDNPFYGNPGPGDFNGDGFDELAYIDTLISGMGAVRRAADPQALAIFNGPESVDMRWQAPGDAAGLAGYRIVVNNFVNVNLDTQTQHHRIGRQAGESIREVRLQSMDSPGNVIGELVRSIDLQDTPLAEAQSSIRDIEFKADGSRVEAERYTLTGKSYGPALGELFWNSTKRFVLVWRNGKLIDRVEGNSYMVREGGEFFITIDYLGDLPSGVANEPFTEGTLRRSNVVSINQADTGTPDNPLPPVNGNTLSPPANLTADVYSASTAELFWDRAPASANVIAYEVVRNGLHTSRSTSSSTGTSFLDSSREPGNEYTYAVTAIARDNGRSRPATVSTKAFGHNSGSGAGVLDASGLVYSSSAVEIFWNTDKLARARPVRFEILQDGQPVAANNGRSFFTGDLSATTTYRYVVVGFNTDGLEVARSQELVLTTR